MDNITLLPTIWALSLWGVESPGVPNEERIYLRANVDVNLAEYFLAAGLRIDANSARPIVGEVYWLGSLRVSTGYWVVVYTGPGEQKLTKLDNGDPALVLHLGKRVTIFSADWIVPMLFHMDGVTVGSGGAAA